MRRANPGRDVLLGIRAPAINDLKYRFSLRDFLKLDIITNHHPYACMIGFPAKGSEIFGSAQMAQA